MREQRAQETVCRSGRNVGCHWTQNLYFVSIIVLQLSCFSLLLSFHSPFVFSVVVLFQMKFLLKNFITACLSCAERKEKKASFHMNLNVKGAEAERLGLGGGEMVGNLGSI